YSLYPLFSSPFSFSYKTQTPLKPLPPFSSFPPFPFSPFSFIFSFHPILKTPHFFKTNPYYTNTFSTNINLSTHNPFKKSLISLTITTSYLTSPTHFHIPLLPIPHPLNFSPIDNKPSLIFFNTSKNQHITFTYNIIFSLIIISHNN
ncbi:hypothetical protein, partial [Bacillus altitudinis]|uniref:hypothetical protein n=1 Tax=Bacillus altitudinis TaxID=293387 RepID=UPI001C92F206